MNVCRKIVVYGNSPFFMVIYVYEDQENLCMSCKFSTCKLLLELYV